MARITVDELKEIYDTELTDAQLTAFIGIASRLVNTLATDPCHTAASLKDLELFLSAHYASARDQRAADEGIGSGEYRVKYQGQWGMGFDGTSYGQTALQIDCSGTLANLGKRRISFNTYTTPDKRIS